MTEKMTLAIGYPIGFVTINGDDYYNIQLNDKTYPINLLDTYIWLEALKGDKDKIGVLDDVVEALYSYGYELNEHYTLEDLETGYNSLLASSLIVELDVENLELFLEEHSTIVPHRVGFGIGIESELITIHHEDEDVEVSPLEYYIWQMSNGVRTLGQMYEEYEKAYEIASNVTMQEAINELSLSSLKEIFVVAFINLYRNNLAYMSNI